MNDNDRALCAAAAGVLRGCGAVAAWGLALTSIAGLVLALTGRSLSLSAWIAYAAVGVAGLAERYFGLRLRLDTALFEGLARGTIGSFAALDGALQGLGLRRTADTPRPIADRIAGTRQLMQKHGILVTLQTALFAVALAMQDWR
ncbi:hypothetical protein QTH97_17380 [Variovorax sp. J22R24]|uniref:hypothetical protein n=1 Tax=Variovorax gracilis TaxID=3053502 RepID=UPI0025757F5A|nr:hypothetical protein [Variovorax sp. J22R24]MDM0106722.1 hypothetical protein [Variovorax sp. J22R24]